MINSVMIGSDGGATNLLALLDDFLLAQRIIVDFETFWNAIGKELGDVINVRHGALVDNMLIRGNENSQKWAIIELVIDWRPNIVTIIAEELP